MKKITKTKIKKLIKELDISKKEFIGFEISNDNIKLIQSNTSQQIYFRIDGYIERWQNNEDTYGEFIERIYDYMNDVIMFYNQGYIK